MLNKQDIDTNILNEDKITELILKLNLLESYKLDLEELRWSNSESTYSDNVDEENREYKNDNNVNESEKLVKTFWIIYKDFLKSFKSIIYKDILPKTTEEHLLSLQYLQVDKIFNNSNTNIYSFDKENNEDKLNELSVNPYNYLLKKIDKIYNEYNDNYNRIFSNVNSDIPDLLGQIKSILNTDFDSNDIIDILSITDIAKFKLLWLEDFEKKSHELKNKFVTNKNNHKSSEFASEQTKILKYFLLQLEIHIDSFVDKLSLDDYDLEQDFYYKFLFEKLDNSFLNNTPLDWLNNTEITLLYEILNRALDIKLLLEQIEIESYDTLYHLNVSQSSIFTIPSFKTLDLILSTSPIFEANKVKKDTLKILEKLK